MFLLFLLFTIERGNCDCFQSIADLPNLDELKDCTAVNSAEIRQCVDEYIQDVPINPTSPLWELLDPDNLLAAVRCQIKMSTPKGR
ncbi:hypothetical protein Y032_0068g228 [Ancylostoma ceylanicum]|nr:hypothetical protein Y032_0068g228 [Ancylostoma ceylanicum]